jgi:hypothetical protein
LSDLECSRVVFVAGDPGGANALAPVIEQLKSEKNYFLSVFAYYKAALVFRQKGIDFIELSNTTTAEQVLTMLADTRPNLIVTATSINPFEVENVFIAGGKRLEIPTLSILDFWSNYTQRFSKDEDDLVYLPDKIAVMDELAVSEMEAQGFPSDRLVITGQPAFDRLFDLRQCLDRKHIRDRLGIGQDSKLILFVSQPFSELFGKNSDNPLYPGYTQQSILQTLLEALEDMIRESDHSIVLGILPHLRETENWWTMLERDRVHIKVLSNEYFEEVSLSSDLVVGMTSTKLVEVALMGCAAISLQIGAEISKRFDMERLGITKMIFEKSTLDTFLEAFLLGNGDIVRGGGLSLRRQATANVRLLMEDMLQMKMKEN